MTAPMDDEVRRMLREQWGLTADRVEPLGGGDECTVWRVSEDLVLRVAAHTRTPQEVLWSCDAAAALSERVPEVVAPILTVSGATAHQHVSVWPFVVGRRADHDDPSIRDQAADLLARLHTVTGRRERGIVHGDYYRGNLLVDGGYIVGLIDWDEARVDDYLIEFAWSMWEFAKSRDETRLLADRADRFAEVYAAAGGLPFGRGESLPAIRERLREEIARSQARRASGLPVDDEYEASEQDALRHLT